MTEGSGGGLWVAAGADACCVGTSDVLSGAETACSPSVVPGRWLLWAAVLSALFAVTAPLPAHAVATGNILLLIADDFGIDVSPFYTAPTRFETTPPAPAIPSIASLAQKGLLFKRAWATPWCSPTRAGILTGRYGFRTGIGRPKTSGLPELALAEVTLPELFQDAAPQYVLEHIGKWHVSNGLDDPREQGWSHSYGLKPSLGRIESYYRWTKVVDGVATTSTHYVTTDLVDEAVRVIDQAAIDEKPYFIWLAFNAPHQPFHKPPNELHTRDSLPTTGAPDRSYFEAMIESLDTEIGRLLQSVDLATTTVIFVGDNGTPSGMARPPYSQSKAKGTMYQGGVHVPLVFAGLGVKGRNRQAKALVNTTDLFPTILELAGIDPANHLLAGVKTDGVSLLPYLQDKPHPSPRKWAFAEQFTQAYDGDWQRAVRDFQYVLIERYDGTREFYNLETDPLQNSNLLARTLTFNETRRLDALDHQLTAIIESR